MQTLKNDPKNAPQKKATATQSQYIPGASQKISDRVGSVSRLVGSVGIVLVEIEIGTAGGSGQAVTRDTIRRERGDFLPRPR